MVVRRLLMAGGAVVALIAIIAVVVLGGSRAVPAEQPRTAGAEASGDKAAAAGRSERPDMVLILMDDFSLELLATMPQALRMQREGATYDNAFVIDSLCCPSRAAMLTGQTPHQTEVLTNTPNDPDHPVGGYDAFVDHGNVQKQFALNLQRSGYTTGYTGKFLNDYELVRPPGRRAQPPPKVPGWTDWRPVLGSGYNGWNFRRVHPDKHGNLQTAFHRAPPRSLSDRRIDRQYVGNVIARDAVRFIKQNERRKAPYFLTVAPYAPHGALDQIYPDDPLYPPAMRDRAPAGDPTGGNCGARACADLSLDDLAGYDDPRWDNAPTYRHRDGSTSTAPAWRTNPVVLTDDNALMFYRDRARMVQSIDRMIKQVRDAAGDDAYIVLTADNGFHLGQHQLNGGKGAPYDSDTRVPLVVVGPDVVPGKRRQFVNNIDLAPTFEELAGVKAPRYRSGRSFVDTLGDPRASGARYAFFEHTYAKIRPGEVDADRTAGGTIDIIPSYIAVRGHRGLLVRLDLDPTWSGTDYAWELYRYDVGWEDRNVFAEDRRRPWARDLMRRLERYDDCRPAVCRQAAR